jgi:RecB family exonuclease
MSRKSCRFGSTEPMTDSFSDPEEFQSIRTPHLSHSRINRYLHCPEQYRLYYIEELRPRAPAVNLVFGKTIHQALAHFFRTGGDPMRFFADAWVPVHEIELTYGERESWEKLRASGEALLRKFVTEEAPQLSHIDAAEKPFEFEISDFDLPFVGVIDLIADLKGKRTVVDFKTSGSSYANHETALSDQLTAYQLAEPDASQAALCVLVKTKEPKIEWHFTTRTGAQMLEYLAKARLIACEIRAGHFYKRPGKWCGWCEFLPVCTGNAAKAKADLVQLTRPTRAPGAP